MYPAKIATSPPHPTIIVLLIGPWTLDNLAELCCSLLAMWQGLNEMAAALGLPVYIPMPPDDHNLPNLD